MHPSLEENDGRTQVTRCMIGTKFSAAPSGRNRFMLMHASGRDRSPSQLQRSSSAAAAPASPHVSWGAVHGNKISGSPVDVPAAAAVLVGRPGGGVPRVRTPRHIIGIYALRAARPLMKPVVHAAPRHLYRFPAGRRRALGRGSGRSRSARTCAAVLVEAVAGPAAADSPTSPIEARGRGSEDAGRHVYDGGSMRAHIVQRCLRGAPRDSPAIIFRPRRSGRGRLTHACIDPVAAAH